MLRRLLALTSCGWLVFAAFAAEPAGRQAVSAQTAASSASYRSIVDQYCVTCHNTRLKTGGLVLEGLDMSRLSGDAETWEKAVRKVRAGVMPPQGARRPDDATTHALVSWLEQGLDRAAADHPNPGRPLLHRLNRAEYTNAIRDLLALDVDATSLLPPDDSAYGFDNISDVLGVSPSLQERYLSAAGRRSAALAIGDPGMRPGERHVSRAAGSVAESAHRGSAARHDRRLARSPHLPARRRVRVPDEALSHQPEHHARPRVRARDRDRRSTAAGAPRTIGGPADLAALVREAHGYRRRGGARLRVRVPVKAGRTW